jgi:hypothetical protein
MIRYYTCPIVGDGTSGNSYRPALADGPGPKTWSAVIPSRDAQKDGRPKYTTCCVEVEADAAVHAALAQLPKTVEVSAEDALAARAGSRPAARRRSP